MKCISQEDETYDPETYCLEILKVQSVREYFKELCFLLRFQAFNVKPHHSIFPAPVLVDLLTGTLGTRITEILKSFPQNVLLSGLHCCVA